ncbi:MAG TPA: ATP phosphoribosyltransferase regulatory subunit [Methylococcus sp.]|nr:ATP phosphoribosyltransferase regulatory subunit [Methylococcus sp.]
MSFFANPEEDRWLLPDGIEELLPEDAERLECLRRRVLDLFAVWGYRLVMPPMIEFIDSLLTGAGRDLDLQTFKLIDQISGRLLGLRADMTPQVARIDARTHRGDIPARFCYLGTVLHTQADHLENSRSPMQVGAELYGHGGIASDLEIIRLMLEVLAAVGIEEVHLDLGHVGIFRGLARQAGLSSEQEAQLFSLLQQKARPELMAVIDAMGIRAPVAGMLLDLVELNGGREVIAKARQRLAAADESVHSALDQLDTLAGALSARCASVPVHFDLAELRGYHYQTGVVFAAFIPGYGREIARGGRYDDIGKVFGKARPATGFSADLKVLLRFSKVSEPCVGVTADAIFAPAVDDPGLVEAVRMLRGAGHAVVEALPGQDGGAAELGCRYELRLRRGCWERVAVAGETAETEGSRTTQASNPPGSKV